jgi:hypothetical protein
MRSPREEEEGGGDQEFLKRSFHGDMKMNDGR